MSARVADRSAAAGTVKIERVFDAPRELVFDAWTKVEHLLQWYAPHGCTVRIVELDARPGGRFHFCIHNPSFGDCWCVGVYREVVRPERIVYTLATADSDGESDRSSAGRARSPVAARNARDDHVRGAERRDQAHARTERVWNRSRSTLALIRAGCRCSIVWPSS